MNSSRRELSSLNRWLREPLLHFLVAGGLLFVVYSWMNRGAVNHSTDPQLQIRIGEGEVKWLSETWSRQWQREPTPEELRGLVTEYVKELLMAREAKDLGLDENDTVVRRRLAQKLEFILQDTSRLAEPTDEELRAIYEANPGQFRSDARASFSHVFFNTDKREHAAADLAAALVELADAEVAPENMGDPLMVEFQFIDADRRTVASQLGGRFADMVLKLKPGAWQGPIESGFGLHLVRVSEVTPPGLLDFEEVRDDIIADWNREREEEAGAKYFASLLEKYDVVVDERVKAVVGPLGGKETTNGHE